MLTFCDVDFDLALRLEIVVHNVQFDRITLFSSFDAYCSRICSGVPFLFCEGREKPRAETIVSRTSADVVSHVTRFNSDDEEEESDDEDNMLRMNTTMVESKVHDEERSHFHPLS